MTTYTIKIKSREALNELAETDEFIMPEGSRKDFGDMIFHEAVLNNGEDETYPGSYSVEDSYLFLPEEIEWVKPEEK